MHERLRLATRPLADPASIVAGPNYRITVLDGGLVRLEYSRDGTFEDRASQAVVDRAFPPSTFTVTETDDRLEIDTDRLHLHYDKGPFRTEGLSVQAKGGYHSRDSVWRFGEPTLNLGGTARTLDEVDGACPLEPGVLSRQGITVVDDSATVLLTQDGWIAPRRPGTHDVYVFAFGRDYRAALRAFYRLCGPQPLLPRYALGNWWSRYHPYSAQEYLDLMDRFAAEGIPLSVGVLDMDWHWVDIDPRHGSGWTGYTWNTDLFPDPRAFLAELHGRGLVSSLNVHPAEGVHPHEAAYPALAKSMGIDPSTEMPVAFDPAAPAFLEAYFEHLHHPLEDEGVDFWWLDWQQGGVTRIAGLDPLWLLNHFHYLDSARRGGRPLTFSRYAGVGSHRYPIGFSGDTVISWASLEFQPYFTATASNIGYGWWSHDIGGHFFGSKDDELAVRWVQFGVLSPITRLHSSLSPFNTKEPWRFGRDAQRVMTDWLRLRHALLPYLGTMNRRAHDDGQPLVQPMYYEHPESPDAYGVPNQYYFGDQLVVAPITTPIDRATGLGAVTAWLPPGGWIDVFTGLTYRGGRAIRMHRDLDTIPVLAKAGAIVPMTPPDRIGPGTDLPDALEIRVHAGADGDFTLAEDRDDERWAHTRVTFRDGEIRIHPVTGEPASVPTSRRYDIVLCGFADITSVEVDEEPVPYRPGPAPGSIEVTLRDIDPRSDVHVTLHGDLSLARSPDAEARLFALIDRAQVAFALKDELYAVVKGADPGLAVSGLVALDLQPALLSALSEVLLANP